LLLNLGVLWDRWIIERTRHLQEVSISSSTYLRKTLRRIPRQVQVLRWISGRQTEGLWIQGSGGQAFREVYVDSARASRFRFVEFKLIVRVLVTSCLVVFDSFPWFFPVWVFHVYLGVRYLSTFRLWDWFCLSHDESLIKIKT
jgi:hypothetical protein